MTEHQPEVFSFISCPDLPLTMVGTDICVMACISFCVVWLAVELLQNEVTEKLPSEAENLQTAIIRLQSALSKAYQYVDDVVVSCSQLLLVVLFLYL